MQPLLARLGNRRAYQYGALVSALAYVVQSQAHRPAAAASKLRMAVQYCVGISLLKTLPDVMGSSMRAMMVKQGAAVSSCGLGQINAAYGGLGQITAVFSALIWGVCAAPLARRPCRRRWHWRASAATLHSMVSGNDATHAHSGSVRRSIQEAASVYLRALLSDSPRLAAGALPLLLEHVGGCRAAALAAVGARRPLCAGCCSDGQRVVADGARKPKGALSRR